MKKKVLPIVMVITVLALCVGCGQNTAASFATDDLQLNIRGTSYRVNMAIDDVIVNLGDGYEYAEGMSCDYDGLDKTFRYEVAEFFTNPLAEGDRISEIYTESADVTTSKGLAVGSTRQEVLAAYGEDCEDEGDLLIYRAPGERVALCFELEDNAVWAIYLTNQSV